MERKTFTLPNGVDVGPLFERDYLILRHTPLEDSAKPFADLSRLAIPSAKLYFAVYGHEYSEGQREIWKDIYKVRGQLKDSGFHYLNLAVRHEGGLYLIGSEEVNQIVIEGLKSRPNATKSARPTDNELVELSDLGKRLLRKAYPLVAAQRPVYLKDLQEVIQIHQFKESGLMDIPTRAQVLAAVLEAVVALTTYRSAQDQIEPDIQELLELEDRARNRQPELSENLFRNSILNRITRY